MSLLTIPLMSTDGLAVSGHVYASLTQSGFLRVNASLAIGSSPVNHMNGARGLSFCGISTAGSRSELDTAVYTEELPAIFGPAAAQARPSRFPPGRSVRIKGDNRSATRSKLEKTGTDASGFYLECFASASRRRSWQCPRTQIEVVSIFFWINCLLIANLAVEAAECPPSATWEGTF